MSAGEGRPCDLSQFKAPGLGIRPNANEVKVEGLILGPAAKQREEPRFPGPRPAHTQPCAGRGEPPTLDFNALPSPPSNA